MINTSTNISARLLAAIALSLLLACEAQAERYTTGMKETITTYFLFEGGSEDPRIRPILNKLSKSGKNAALVIVKAAECCNSNDLIIEGAFFGNDIYDAATSNRADFEKLISKLSKQNEQDYHAYWIYPAKAGVPYEAMSYANLLADLKRQWGIDSDLTKLDNRMGVAETEIQKLQTRAAAVEDRATKLEKRATAVEARTTKLEDRTEKVEARTTDLEDRATKVETRTTTLESDVKTLNQKTKDLADEINGLKTRVDKIDSKLTELSKAAQELNATTKSMKQFVEESLKSIIEKLKK
jgi:prefoldin subunit 5